MDTSNIEFKMSQRLDLQLSGIELQELDRLIDSDPALCEEMHKYESLNHELDQLAQTPLPFSDADFRKSRLAILETVDRKMNCAKPNSVLKFILKPQFAAAIAALLIMTVGIFSYILLSDSKTAPTIIDNGTTVVDNGSSNTGENVVPVKRKITVALAKPAKPASDLKISCSIVENPALAKIDKKTSDNSKIIMICSPSNIQTVNHNKRLRISPIGFWPTELSDNLQ